MNVLSKIFYDRYLDLYILLLDQQLFPILAMLFLLFCNFFPFALHNLSPGLFVEACKSRNESVFEKHVLAIICIINPLKMPLIYLKDKI